jgi:hypothetical protein
VASGDFSRIPREERPEMNSFADAEPSSEALAHFAEAATPPLDNEPFEMKREYIALRPDRPAGFAS